MFNQTPNNSMQGRDPGITIRIKTLYGDTASLQLSFWNEKLSVKINPLTGVSPEGIRQYDYNRKANTALSPEKCSALLEKLEKELSPIVAETQKGKPLDAPMCVAVQVGANKIIAGIEYKLDEKGVPHYYFTLFTNVQDNKATTKECIYSYKFTKYEVIVGYDPVTGEGNSEWVDSEFEFFKSKMGIVAAGKSPAISTKPQQPSNNQGGGYNNGGYTNGGYNNNNSYAPQQPYNPQVAAPSSYQAPVGDFSEELPFV